MVFTKLATVAGLVAASQAFLIPPEIAKIDIVSIEALPFELVGGTFGGVVQVDCAGCHQIASEPAEPEDASPLRDIVQDKLSLNISVAGGDKLLVNEMKIYPAPWDTVRPLQAAQSSEYSSAVKDVHIGYQFAIGSPHRTIREADWKLIDIDFQIVEVDDEFIDGLDNVKIELIQGSDGTIRVASMKTAPTTNPIMQPGQDCTSLLCQWKSFMADKLSMLKPKKGCGRKAGGVGRPRIGAHPFPEYFPKDFPRPHHKGHHAGHRYHDHHDHHGMRGFFKVLKSVVFHIFVPILIGIAAGITASFLGMVVGSLVVLVWRAVFRRGGRGAYSRVQDAEVDDEERVDTDNKGSLVEHQGPPPLYEEVIIIDEKSVAEEKSDN